MKISQSFYNSAVIHITCHIVSTVPDALHGISHGNSDFCSLKHIDIIFAIPKTISLLQIKGFLTPMDPFDLINALFPYFDRMPKIHKAAVLHILFDDLDIRRILQKDQKFFSINELKDKGFSSYKIRKLVDEGKLLVDGELGRVVADNEV